MRVGSLRLEADAYLSPGVYMPGDFFAHGVHHPCISYTGLIESARFRCGASHGKFPGGHKAYVLPVHSDLFIQLMLIRMETVVIWLAVINGTLLLVERILGILQKLRNR